MRHLVIRVMLSVQEWKEVLSRSKALCKWVPRRTLHFSKHTHVIGAPYNRGLDYGIFICLRPISSEAPSAHRYAQLSELLWDHPEVTSTEVLHSTPNRCPTFAGNLRQFAALVAELFPSAFVVLVDEIARSILTSA